MASAASTASSTSWSGKCATVDAWLRSVYKGQPVPDFEINQQTIDLLHAMATENESKNRLTTALAEDAEEKGREYRIQADASTRVLSKVGLRDDALSPSAQSSLRALVRVANALKIRCVREDMLTLGVCDLIDEHTELCEKLAESRRATSAIRDEHSAATAKAESFKARVSEADERRASADALSSQKAENVAYLRQKCEQYRRKIIEYKALLDASGYTPEVSHRHLCELGQEIRAVEAETAPLVSKIRTYHQLPPDFELACLKIEQVRAELLRVEEQLAESITSSLNHV